MKTKIFFCILCLTVALSANSSPVYAQLPLEAYVETLRFLNTPLAQQMLQRIFQTTTSQPETTSQSQEFPVYSDGEWVVYIQQDGNDAIYYGVNLNSKAEITLRNVTIQGNQQRPVLSWNNGDTTYQIAYQVNDPGFVRLQVFEGSDLLLNRLLTRYVVNR